MGTEGKYTEVNGTFYYKGTNYAVVNVLEKCKANRIRIKLDYGNTETGQSWGETNDILGYVGRSSGSIKIPLLIYNSRSMGGGAILTDSIVQIKESKGGKILYQHPNYKAYENI